MMISEKPGLWVRQWKLEAWTPRSPDTEQIKDISH